MGRPEKTRTLGTTVRLPVEAHRRLRELAGARGETLQETLVTAIERLRREWMFDELDAHYARLEDDASSWQQELDERAAWAAIETWDAE